MGVDPNLRTPYIMNFNLGIQHQFGNNFLSKWDMSEIAAKG